MFVFVNIQFDDDEKKFFFLAKNIIYSLDREKTNLIFDETYWNI